MSVPIQLKRGKRAAVDSMTIQGEHLVGQPILVTDENRLVIGTGSKSIASVARGGYSFSVSDTTSTTINTDQIWSVISHIEGGGFNTTTGQYTTPIAGVYHFTTSLLLDGVAAAGDVRIGFVFNGLNLPGSAAIFYKTANQYLTMHHSMTVNLSAGVTVSVRIPYTSAGSFPIYTGSNAWNSFSGFLVA